VIEAFFSRNISALKELLAHLLAAGQDRGYLDHDAYPTSFRFQTGRV
jgi:hypothetical protein